ncbi:MAG: SRPBCC domain-containing protein [Methanobacteriota archaeon]
MAYDHTYRLRVAAPRPVVFERLLRIEHLARWFCGWARIEPKVGGSFKFGGETCIFLPEGTAWSTTIEQGEVLHRFAFTWPIRDARTRVAYDLEDDGESACVLTARHVGVPLETSTCGSVQDAWRTCLGNLKAISEGRADGVRPEHSPAAGPEVRLTCLVEAAADRVFDALADADQADRWASGGPPSGAVEVDRRAGGAYSLADTYGAGEIVDLQEGRRLSVRWAAAAPERRLVFELESKASGTAVYVSLSGYGSGDAPRALRDRGRWSDRLVCLRNLIEAGDPGFLDPYPAQVRET